MHRKRPGAELEGKRPTGLGAGLLGAVGLLRRLRFRSAERDGLPHRSDSVLRGRRHGTTRTRAHRLRLSDGRRRIRGFPHREDLPPYPEATLDRRNEGEMRPRIEGGIPLPTSPTGGCLPVKENARFDGFRDTRR